MRSDLVALQAFIEVARDNSFTKAAARLGLAQSSLSRTIRDLEESLGVRLFSRTTRSVSLTDAGERLLRTAAPRLAEIAAEMSALTEMQSKPAGLVRITCSEMAARLIWGKLSTVMHDYPDITVELFTDHSFTDIAAERFDAGVRLGESLEKDMIAVRIGPDERLIPVGAPSYFAQYPVPIVPQDLTAHRCINLRLETRGEIYAWEFEKDGRPLRIRVEGPWIFNSVEPTVQAALAGYGIAFVPEHEVLEHLQSVELIAVLDDWCQPFTGFHLYYPSRRQNSAAFEIVVNALRHRG
ncbi:LysR family transcriptional regulator [Donghicola mangrovi]|uniref:LysR family transcriptional regulator n=1 Tax=Donghicola mangrovi TaxID=2729614 RepID=A0A850QCW7_9RHOB|nr:LysR family transcriptional regulator [Donghicola mangrovi]NVO24740.1 LysR family transcriptional regulator [Donghicola mangrovi]